MKPIRLCRQFTFNSSLHKIVAPFAATARLGRLQSRLLQQLLLADAENLRFQAAQKDLRGKAREESTSGSVHPQYVDASRSSATKHMSLFQQPD
jgi:hypothetical protein